MNRKPLLLLAVFVLAVCAFYLGRATSPADRKQGDHSYPGTYSFAMEAPSQRPNLFAYSYVTEAPKQKEFDDLVEQPKKTQMVYVSRTGTKYHLNPNCSNMKNPYYKSLDEAIDMGRTPCSKCAK